MKILKDTTVELDSKLYPFTYYFSDAEAWMSNTLLFYHIVTDPVHKNIMFEKVAFNL